MSDDEFGNMLGNESELDLRSFQLESGADIPAQPTTPRGRNRKGPPDVKGLKDKSLDDLRDLYEELLAWSVYAEWMLGYAQSRVAYVSNELDENMEDAAAQSTETSVAAKERAAKLQPRVRDLRREVIKYNGYVRHWKALLVSVDKGIAYINRDITLRSKQREDGWRDHQVQT